jgi:hypothetical protein
MKSYCSNGPHCCLLPPRPGKVCRPQFMMAAQDEAGEHAHGSAYAGATAA